MFQDIRNLVSLYNDVTPTKSHFWEGPIELPSYICALKEAYSCVAGDVACNACPAVPSEADKWSGMTNNE
eukprot:CAMPEP_0174925804 /NCGR_PEP_ID=MMETSP1355-20121228/8158_1 /TAXON_ID=464990 /ORGANISM="Hemiselmis tepida, Strain CCMP443" /LENGTH=69 /DNA_ID=CAMNT_0016171761 /DNA_START=42 /DNA_END=251 /DNA_ORIENTATION=+